MKDWTRNEIDIPIQYLRDALEYNDGRLTWKHRPLEQFKNEKFQRVVNTKFAGKEAFANINKQTGYAQGSICGKLILRSVIIFALMHGRWPTRSVNHINEIKTDDRIENLRETVRNKAVLRNE